MKQVLRFLAVFLLLTNAVLANNVTGTMTTPNTSVPIKNATVTFTLNQAAVVAGSYLLTTTPVSCYTSTDGALKGLPNPLVAPSVSTGAGSVSAGTYYITYSYYGSGVETLVSGSTAKVLASTGSLIVAAPSLQPANATGYKVYAFTSDATYKLQATTSGWGSTTISTYTAVGTAAPSSNSSVCSLTFNDATIPAPTTYRVAATDANGNNVAGFPQQWYLAGSAVDISNQYPVANNVQARFPQPIIANPSSNATQSVNSPLTLNGYDMKVGAINYTGLSTHALSSSGQAVIYYDTSVSKLYASVNGGSYVDLLATAAGPWTLSGNVVRLTTLTNTVVLSQATTEGTTIMTVVNTAGLGVDTATTDASTLTLAIPSSVATLEAGITGIGTYLPLAIRVNGGEAARFTTASRQYFVGSSISSTDIGTGSGQIIGINGVTAANASTNAVLTRLQSFGGGSGYGAVIVDYSGTAGYKPMAFFTNNTEGMRLDTTSNLLIGATTADETTQGALQVYRSQNTGTWSFVRNASTGTLAYAALVARSGAAASTNDYTLGVTSSGFTPTGGLVASGAFLKSGAGATGGITIQSAAGTIKFQPGGSTTEMTLTTGTGVTLAHALPQTSGGTGQTTAITNTRLVVSDGTAYQGYSTLTFTSSNGFLSATRLVAPGVAATTPPLDTGSVQMYYNSSSDKATILAAANDGAGSGTGKTLLLASGEAIFQIGSPSTLASRFGVTSNGPKWWVAMVATGATATTLANVPTGASGTMRGWAQIELSTGQVAFVPVWY